MDNFLDLYDQYLEKILYAVENYSGKHSINMEKAEEWINSQPFPEAQQAARNIIKHTKYVTMIDVYNNIESLVLNQYKTLLEKKEKKEKKIIMIVGKQNKSFFFLSVLAVYFMKKHGLRIPDEFHFDFISLYKNKTDTIICFDDMSYTGSQLGEMFETSINYNLTYELCHYVVNKYEENNINNIEVKKYVQNIKEKKIDYFKNGNTNYFYNQIALFRYLAINEFDKDIINKELLILLSNLNFPDFNIFLLGLNNNSLKKLTYFYRGFSYLPLSNLVKDLNIQYKSPFNINYYEIIPMIEELVDEKELYYIVYYFSYMVCPNVLIYYDFKIADQVSTIANTYNYGPIVPKDFDLYNYFPPIKLLLENKQYFIDKSLETTNVAERYKYLIYKYYTIPSNPSSYTKTKLSFCPFLNNCYQVYNIINDPRMENLDYLLLFMSGELDIKYINTAVDEISYIQYHSYNDSELILFIVFNEISKKNESKSIEDIKDEIINEIKETYKFTEFIREQKCGLSFYKNPDYKITYDGSLSANLNGGKKKFMTIKKYKFTKTPKKKYTAKTKKSNKGKTKKTKKCNILYKKYKKNTI